MEPIIYGCATLLILMLKMTLSSGYELFPYLSEPPDITPRTHEDEHHKLPHLPSAIQHSEKNLSENSMYARYFMWI